MIPKAGHALTRAFPHQSVKASGCGCKEWDEGKSSRNRQGKGYVSALSCLQSTASVVRVG